ncbi:MAG: hypothetical protein RLZZ292_517 [Bacteroidota bacterium]
MSRFKPLRGVFLGVCLCFFTKASPNPSKGGELFRATDVMLFYELHHGV